MTTWKPAPNFSRTFLTRTFPLEEDVGYKIPVIFEYGIDGLRK